MVPAKHVPQGAPETRDQGAHLRGVAPTVQGTWRYMLLSVLGGLGTCHDDPVTKASSWVVVLGMSARSGLSIGRISQRPRITRKRSGRSEHSAHPRAGRNLVRGLRPTSWGTFVSVERTRNGSGETADESNRMYVLVYIDGLSLDFATPSSLTL
jgi:hypothetical protein